jgi:hypothetical protein
MTKLIFGLLLSIAASLPARAGPGECQEAARAYKDAHRDLLEAIHAYGRCVAQSDEHDDCSAEFSSVRSAQEDFERAVDGYQDECR